MRLVVFTDVHANLPALDTALSSIREHGYDLLVHAGDAIGIGPFPAECVDRLLSCPNAHLLMGNHDAWFAHGLPEPQPTWMSAGEILHQKWTHDQLDPGLKQVITRWRYVLSETIEQVPLSFLHYPLTEQQEFISVIREPTVADLDRMFTPYSGDIIFYGHHHPASDVQGRARYINPGSLGCAKTSVARYCIVDIKNDQYTIEHKTIPYDDALLFKEFERREVPERKFIYKAFFGGRFEGSS